MERKQDDSSLAIVCIAALAADNVVD